MAQSQTTTTPQSMIDKAPLKLERFVGGHTFRYKDGDRGNPVLWLTIARVPSRDCLRPAPDAKCVYAAVQGVVTMQVEQGVPQERWFGHIMDTLSSAVDKNLVEGIKGHTLQYDGNAETLNIYPATRQISIGVNGDLAVAVSRPKGEQQQEERRGAKRTQTRDTETPLRRRA